MADFRSVDTAEGYPTESLQASHSSDAIKVAQGILNSESQVSLGKNQNLSIIPSESNSLLSESHSSPDIASQPRRETSQVVDTQKENPFILYFSQLDTDRAKIKTEYRRLARQLHPDTNKNPDATSSMQDLNEAYAKILDQLDFQEGKVKSTSRNIESFSPTKNGILSESQKITGVFADLGYPADQLPPITEQSLALLEKQTAEVAQGVDGSLYLPEEGKDAVDQEGKTDWRKVAVWFAIVSVDLLWNHGRGMEHMFHEFIRSDAVPSLFKWMGVEDTEILESFLSNPGDMSKALLHLSEAQLHHLLVQFSQNQVYDLLAGLSDHERGEFVTRGTYGHHEIPEDMRHHLLGKLSEKQKSILKLHGPEGSDH